MLSPKSCAICYEDLNDRGVALPCGHDNFCGQCMVNQLLLDTRCPICRHDSGKREAGDVRSDEREESDTRVEEVLPSRLLLLGSVTLTFTIVCFNIVYY